MKSISKYTLGIISILFFWGNALFVVAGEEKQEQAKSAFKGFFVDLDLADPFLSIINANRSGINASVQVDIAHSVFPVVEIGYAGYEGSEHYSYLRDSVPGSPVITQPEDYRYSVNGLYYKIGFDLNLLSKKPESKIVSIGYLGVRYCISPFNYEIENLKVKDFFWDQEYYFNAKGSSVAQWAEFVAGVKTPIYKNFCLGASVRFRQFLHIKEDKTGNKAVHSSFVPGYGEKENDIWGFRYTISYFFPFTK